MGDPQWLAKSRMYGSLDDIARGVLAEWFIESYLLLDMIALLGGERRRTLGDKGRSLRTFRDSVWVDDLGVSLRHPRTSRNPTMRLLAVEAGFRTWTVRAVWLRTACIVNQNGHTAAMSQMTK